MSGHSKWSTIKRQKAVVDAKRGAIFTKLANLISLAAKQGSDPDMNPSLKSAIEQAKEANMPKNNIDRAIKKGSGELASEQVEEIIYEGIGPANVQFIVQCLTDNRNRSVANIRHLFSKYGGSLATVKWNFDIIGLIIFSVKELSKNKINLEDLQLDLIDRGIFDLKTEAEDLIILTKVKDLNIIVSYLRDRGIKINSAKIEYLAKDRQNISKNDQEKLTKFIDDLENIEDVNDYYHNIAYE